MRLSQNYSKNKNKSRSFRTWTYILNKITHKLQATGGWAHNVQALKPQAASDKRPNLPLMVGGWAHSSQAL